MNKWVRPFLLVTIVSFLLGLWLSLRRAEKSLILELRALPEIVLLTDHPKWWTSIKSVAKREGIAELRLVTLPRRRWSEIALASSDKEGCDLMAVPSYFVRHFSTQKWTQNFPVREESLWDQVHPDFRDVPSGIGRGRFLPLLWTLSLWQANPENKGPLEVRTSLDEALLLALDLFPSELDLAEPEGSDAMDFVRQLWTKSSKEIDLNLNPTDKSDSTKSAKAVQTYATRSAADFSPTERAPQGDKATLFSYGVSLCTSSRHLEETISFARWLASPENVTLLSYASGMASALSSSEADSIPKTLRPSYLRHFPLAQIRQREIGWDLASAWYDFMMSEMESSAASR